MKDLQKLLKKPLVFVLLVSSLALIIMVILTFTLILPKYSALTKLASENKDSEKELATLTKNIAKFSKIDIEEIEGFSKIVNNLIPEQKDALRFLTLAEIVAFASEVKVADAQVTSGKKATSSPADGAQSPQSNLQEQSSKGLLGAVYAQGTQTPQTTEAVSNLYTIKISVEGTFQNILKYLSNFKKADRLVGAGEISIGEAGELGGLSAVIDFDLPLSKSTAMITPNEAVNLTQEDRELLQDLAESIVFSASPSQNPLGKPDPFK